jgi:orotate phosphoribosyltransferase-like protein
MTATWRTREELVHQVVILAEQGVSRRALTRALGVSRNTVRALLREHARSRAEPHTALAAAPARAPRASPLDAHLPRIVLASV